MRDLTGDGATQSGVLVTVNRQIGTAQIQRVVHRVARDLQRAAERAVRRAATDRDVRVEVFANVARQAIADQRADRAARVRMVARDPAEQAAP